MKPFYDENDFINLYLIYKIKIKPAQLCYDFNISELHEIIF